MSNVVKKTIIASLAALTIGLGVAASATPAEAQRFHGGGGGFHGGGWHGGGGWRGGGWRGGGWGPGIGFGIIGGLAAGAIIASQAPYYGYYGYPGYYGYGGYGGCVRYRPIYDQWGNYVGQRPVNVCY